MSYHHLSSAERYVVHHLVLLKLSNREIGSGIGRHHTTTGRELKRNSRSYGPYLYEVAEQIANQRRCQPQHAKRQSRTGLVDQVLAWLKQDWSPLIIVALLSLRRIKAETDNSRLLSYVNCKSVKI